MSALRLRAPLALAFACSSACAWAQVATDGAVQNFDTLLATGSGTTLPAGWVIAEAGSNANGAYVAGTGSSNAGDTYSFGTTAERALGGLRSGNLVPILGAQLQNSTGGTLSDLLVTYTGEHWRRGTASRADRLDFEYSLNANGAADIAATWVAVDALDYASPGGTATGALDGNLPANRTTISATIGGLALAPNATLWVRWTDLDASNADDGLAIDDVSFGQAVDNPPTLLSSTPADNATGVAVGSTILLTFSEVVITTADPWFTLVCGGNSVMAAVSGSGATRTLTPSPALPFNSNCVVDLDEAQIRDNDGTFETLVAGALGYTDFDFTTAADVAPTVSTIVPAHNATNVAATANIVLTFSEPVAVAPNAADWIALSCNGSNVPGMVSGGLATYTFDPAASLVPDATCSVTLQSSGVSDVDGTPQALTGQLVYAFTVAPDLAPALSSSYPTDGATNVPPASDLTVVFTEAVDALPNAFSLACPEGSPIMLAANSADGISWQLAPATDLPADQDCVLTVEADAITDRDGTPTAPIADIVIDFMTGAGLAGYYERVDASSCRMLRATLHGTIDDHSAVVYTDTGDSYTPGVPSTYDVWEVLNLADEDPNDPTKVLDIYKNESYTKIPGGQGVYNREHTWPNSHGFNDLDTLDGGPNAPYTDTHMLMVSNSEYNSARNNRAYGVCNPASVANCQVTDNSETFFNATNGLGGGAQTYVVAGLQLHNWYTPGGDGGQGRYEIWHHRRGDVARGMLYMDLRYEGGRHARTNQREPNLILTDTDALIVATASEVFQAVGYSGRLSALLAWAAEDAPTALEGLRNDIVESVQGNRNPFTDHPEWVAIAFATPCNGPTVIAVDDDFATPVSTPLSVAAPGVLRDDRNGANTNGEGLTAALVTQAANGMAAITPATGAFTYTPNAGFCGTDTFVYSATDGATSDQATVHVTVGGSCGGNAQPVANNATFALAENAAAMTAVGQVIATDPDAGQALSYAITAGNGSGAFAINAMTGAITVANAAPLDFETTPQFVLTVTVTDNGMPPAADTATITINLSNVDEGIALANDDMAVVVEDSGLNTIAVLGNDTPDPDGGATTVIAVGTALHGSTSFSAGNVSYAPAANYCGSDSFTYTVSGNDTASVAVTVSCLNDAPVAGDASFQLPENTAAGTVLGPVLATELDAGQTLTYAITAGNGAGAFAIDAGNGTLTVANAALLDFETTPQFALVVTVTDNGTPALNDTANVLVTLTNVDEGGAQANDDNATVAEDSAANVIDVLANDGADPDGGANAVASVSTALHGVTSFTAANVSYTPAANYCGADVFTYTLGSGATATVAVTVTCVGDAPTTVGTLPDRIAMENVAIAPATVASAFAFTPGDGPLLFTADNLPPGLSIDGVTGIISGTPAAGSAADYDVTVRATNATGQATQAFTFTVLGTYVFADGFED